MTRQILKRIAVTTCAVIISITSLGAYPFKKSEDIEDQLAAYDVDMTNIGKFNLDAGAASITEKDFFVDVKKEEETPVEQEVIQEEPDTFFMAKVQNSVNVRAEANTECEVVGMLYNGCGGDILEEGDGWTRVRSGELEGWVRNDFLYLGDEAREYAEEVCSKIAKVNVECLRIRKGPSLDSMTDGLFEINSEWEILEDPNLDDDDWVCVDYKGAKRYVAAEYVDIELFVEEGETMEEIKAREAIAALEKAKLTANQGAYSASVDEVTLLAALIHTEAGNQPYDGKLAVGAVVLNRVKSPKYPNSIAEVIYAPGQFGPASNGSLAQALQNGIDADCLQAAREALEGATTVGDAKSFHRAGGGENGIVIGAHVFY